MGPLCRIKEGLPSMKTAQHLFNLFLEPILIQLSLIESRKFQDPTRCQGGVNVQHLELLSDYLFHSNMQTMNVDIYKESR